MAGLKTNLGKKIALNRIYKADPDYTHPSQFKIGTGTTAATVADTDLGNAIPIDDGTTLDTGANTLTGSNGGDSTTNNTTYYKPGSNQTDNTGQNLIANNTSVTKTWFLANISTVGNLAAADEYTSLWLWINDDATLEKFATSGTCLQVKLGSDSSNYYSKTFEVSSLQTGWNWIQLGILNTNTETGTVGSPIVYFEIVITTNNSTDMFVANDVVYDLLRQWTVTDLFKDFDSITIDEANLEVSMVGQIYSSEAVGFDISELGSFNKDATPKLDGRDVFTAKSKSSGDEFKFVVKDGVE